MSRPYSKRVCRKKAFRGHDHYRKAHQHILSHPLKTEAVHFETRDFTTGQFFWNLKATSCRQSSVSATADLLRDNWNNTPSGEEVLTILRAIPEMGAEVLCNRLIFAQYQELFVEMRRELEQSGTAIFDFHKTSSMSVLPILVMQQSPRVGLYAH